MNHPDHHTEAEDLVAQAYRQHLVDEAARGAKEFADSLRADGIAVSAATEGAIAWRILQVWSKVPANITAREPAPAPLLH